MPKSRLAAATLALAIAYSVVGHTTVASAYDMSCLPPIDDCVYKWYMEPTLVMPGSEGTQMNGDGGAYEFHWRNVALNFDASRGDIPPLDAGSYLPCENKGNDGVNGLGYSGGGGG